MSSFEIALLVVLIWLCTYAFLDRICKCIEACANQKTTEKAWNSYIRGVGDGLKQAGMSEKSMKNG